MRNVIVVTVLLAISCNPRVNKEKEPSAIVAPVVKEEIILPKKDSIVVKSFKGIADSTFVRLADFSSDFVYDMRYATENNFLKAKVYDCAECYTRARTAKALIAANKAFMTLGYKIKFFDCYRPNSVQYKMWKLVPNAQYVASPVKGSIHNKGGAVDITLEDFQGNELDMGTDFDFFGKRAHHDYTALPEQVLANRKLLKETMEQHGFWSIRTEWWHYNLTAGSRAPIANFKWPCPQ
ncbi:MAG: M15 family metallopeptidase [Bacteroidota bacterium]